MGVIGRGHLLGSRNSNASTVIVVFVPLTHGAGTSSGAAINDNYLITSSEVGSIGHQDEVAFIHNLLGDGEGDRTASGIDGDDISASGLDLDGVIVVEVDVAITVTAGGQPPVERLF